MRDAAALQALDAIDDRRFAGVRPDARYSLKGNGEVFLSYVVGFATDDALVESCQALLTDPRFDADRVRRCLRDSCQRFSGIIGEAFREMVAERTYTALQSCAMQGRPAGGKRFGYAEGEAETARQVFA